MGAPRSVDDDAAVAAEADDIRSAVAGLTVPGVLGRQIRDRPDAVSIRWRRNGSWQAWTWRQYGEQVARVAGALEGLGFGRGDRLLLLTHPEPELSVLDAAALLLGGCPISIYNSSPPDRIRHLAGHSRARIVVVEDDALLARVLAVRAELPALEHVVVLFPGSGPLPPGVLTWPDLAGGGPVDLAGDEPVDLAARAALVQPDDLCTVIYTSGTTGLPKGVMLTHAAVLWQCESYRRRLDRNLTGARWISYLPVAHIATRWYAQYLHAFAGLENVFCPNPAEVESVLVEFPPQLFFAPPRLWESSLVSLRRWIDGLPDRRRADLLTRAMRVGAQAAAITLDGGEVPADLSAEVAALRPLADELRARLGLVDVLTAATGAAPTSPQLMAAWIGLGVPLFEGYGLSESTGMLTVDPFAYRYGRVGRPMPGVELRIADDGELLFRAGSAFAGYLDDPDLTAATVEPDGFVHTGDLGDLVDGYVVLTGRKKELIITAGGENVSPVGVEFALTAQPLIGQACVVGDGQPALGALVVLDEHAAAGWAAGHGLPTSGLTDLPELVSEVGREIAEANRGLVRQERVHRFRVLAGEWRPDTDELTPTAKLRRPSIADKYADEIAAMFAGPPNVPLSR